MKYLRWLVLPFFSCLAVWVVPSGAAAADLNPLLAERWKFRPVVVVVPSEADPLLVRLRGALKETAVREAFIERKMVLYTVVGGVGRRDGVGLSSAETAALLSSVGVGVGRLSAEPLFLLVGLDGGVKIREGRGVDLQSVFAEVDRMPMRRER